MIALPAAICQRSFSGTPAICDWSISSDLGQRVTTADELIVAIRKRVPGARLTLVYVRDGSRHTTVVTLGSARSD